MEVPVVQPLTLQKVQISLSEGTARVEAELISSERLTISDSTAKSLNATADFRLYASGAGEGYYTPTIPTLTVDEYANSSPVPVSVTFKRGGSNLPVAGFASSDISVSGGTVSNFSSFRRWWTYLHF